MKELKVNKKNYRREQEAVAEQEKATINDFESHLTLAKFQT